MMGQSSPKMLAKDTDVGPSRQSCYANNQVRPKQAPNRPIAVPLVQLPHLAHEARHHDSSDTHLEPPSLHPSHWTNVRKETNGKKTGWQCEEKRVDELWYLDLTIAHNKRNQLTPLASRMGEMRDKNTRLILYNIIEICRWAAYCRGSLSRPGRQSRRGRRGGLRRWRSLMSGGNEHRCSTKPDDIQQEKRRWACERKRGCREGEVKLGGTLIVGLEGRRALRAPVRETWTNRWRGSQGG